MSGSSACLGCGEPHGPHDAICPRTKRAVGEGPFGTLVGPYRVGKLLGAGGFGAVYVAEDTRTGESVALKLLNPELVADADVLSRFLREAEITLRSGNPHIVRVLDVSFGGRSVYLALELLRGETLANLMSRGPVQAEHAVDIAIQVLDGLAVAHAAGVIHRDIKPANLFLVDAPGAERPLLKILDFGIGRLLTVDENQRLTRTGLQLGTPHFMAPEQMTDAKRADARADLYAVAATLYAMLTAERPYGNVTVGDWLGFITHRVAPPRVRSPLGPLPPALVEAIAIGLSIDPAARFQDAGAFARALLDALPNSEASTRALPALWAIPTFAASAASPARVYTANTAGDAPPATRVPPYPSAAHRERRQPAALWLAGAVLIAIGVLAGGLVAGAGVLAYSRGVDERTVSPEQPPTTTRVTFAPIAQRSTDAPSVGAPPPSGGAPTSSTPGVHFSEPVMFGGEEVNLDTVRGVLRSDPMRFERCRVAGRAAHARFLVFVEHNELSTTGPYQGLPEDFEVSRCVASQFNWGSVGVRYFPGSNGQVLVDAALDAR